jgi:restriction endonuclease S subunit
MVPGKEMTLWEVCEYEFGSRVTNTKDGLKQDYNGIKYNVYGGGGATFQVDKYNREKGTLIISRFGVSPNCVRIVNEKFFLNDSGMSLTYKNNNNSKKYIENYLLTFQNKIYKYAEGQGQKNMQTIKLFREFKIPVPSPEDQEKVVKMIEDINKEESEFSNQVKTLKETIAKLYQCVEQLVNNNQDETKQDVIHDDAADEQLNCEESDKESDESETESDDTEELEIKGKIYIREGTNVYVKNKKGLKGELYGTWNASTNKVKKISAPKNIEV